MVLKAAFEADLIDAEQLSRYSAYECATEVRRLTDHALTTRDYLKKYALENPKWMAENRTATVGARAIRLPSLYVQQVLDAFHSDEISGGKAAEMLMMEEETFLERFASPS